MAKKSALQGGLNAAIIVAATIAIAVLVNILGGTLYGRMDLTEHQVNLLSDASKDAAAALDELEVRVYISPDLPESIPLGPNRNLKIQAHPQKLKDKIAEYKSHAGGSMTVTYVSDNVVETAEKAKLKPFTGKGGALSEKGQFEFKKFVLGATFHYKNAMEVFDLALEPEFYEFEITKRLLRLKSKAEQALTMKDVLGAGLVIRDAVKGCANDVAAAAPEQDNKNPLMLLSNEATDAKIAGYRAGKATFDTSCGGIDAALEGGRKLDGKNDQLDRMVLIANAFGESYKGFSAALDADDKKNLNVILGESSRLLAIGDAIEQEHSDLLDSPGRRRIGFVCDGVTFCPFGAKRPLIAKELKGALTQKNPILGQLLPQLERIEQEINGTLAQINQGLFKARGFDIVRIDLDEDVPEDVKALIVFGPKATFSDFQLYQLDQFALGGGSLVVFLNPWDVSILNMNNKGELKEPALTRNGSNIGQLLASWGVTPTGELLLEPSSHDDIVLMNYLRQGQRLIPFQPRRVKYPMMPILREFDDSDPLVRATTSITLPFATTLTLSGGAKALVSSSADAVTASDPSFPLEPSAQLTKIASQAGTGAKTVAAIVSGDLKSHFAGKDAPVKPETPSAADAVEKDAAKNAADEATKRTRLDAGAGRVLVIGSNLGLEPLSNEAIFEGFNLSMISGESMDYIEKFRDYQANYQNWTSRIQQVQHTLADNLQFMSNALDWSIQRDALVELRSKRYARRPLDQVGDGSQTGYKFAAVVGTPLLFMLFGLGYWVMRRKRQRGLKL